MTDPEENKLTRIGDIIESGFPNMAESAYRRGYTQGYFRALEDVKNGANLFRLFDFQYSELYIKWRISDKGSRTHPPEYQRQRRENDQSI